MTEKDFVDDGWRPIDCKIGRMYFKGDFFARLVDDGIADIRAVTSDMYSLGTAKDMREVSELEKKWYKDKACTLRELADEYDKIAEKI